MELQGAGRAQGRVEPDGLRPGVFGVRLEVVDPEADMVDRRCVAIASSAGPKTRFIPGAVADVWIVPRGRASRSKTPRIQSSNNSWCGVRKWM